MSWPYAHRRSQWKTLAIFAAFENNGNTPAIEVVTTFSIEDHLPNGQEFIQLVKGGRLRKTVTGPKAPLFLGPQDRTDDFIFGQQAMKPAVKFKTFTSDRTIVLVGWIAYRDVFPNTQLHVTEFCQQLAMVSLSFKDAPPKVVPRYPLYDFAYQSCPEHNCTDEYCSDYKEPKAFVETDTLRK